MTDKINKLFAEISAKAKELNERTDSFTEAILDVEIGIKEACVRVASGEIQLNRHYSISYGEHNGKWGIKYHSHSYKHINGRLAEHDIEDKGFLLDAPPQIKQEAVPRLPELLENVRQALVSSIRYLDDQQNEGQP